MLVSEGKELVVKAGRELLASGLVARTWGNVSCRISDTQFAITPSGRSYETLAPDEVVTVNMADLSYEGAMKPSSESGIHAAIYQLKPEINFVIHTHQPFASVVSTLSYDLKIGSQDAEDVIGSEVKCAAYGLPGTKKLQRAVVKAFQQSPSYAVLMANHGAVCVGVDYSQAFQVAYELEKICEEMINKRFLSVFRPTESENTEMDDASLAKKSCFDSVRLGDILLVYINKTAVKVNLKTGEIIEGPEQSLPGELELHRAVYNKRKDINYIVHSQESDILTLSAAGITLKPMLDDLAQIVGTSIRTAEWKTHDKTSKVVAALKGRHAVFIKGAGALCCGFDQEDAEAVEIVLQKGCKAYIGSSFFGKPGAINPLECKLMRIVYLYKYSQLAKK